MRERVRVECAWTLALAAGPAAAVPRPPAGGSAPSFWPNSGRRPGLPPTWPRSRQIEARTNHDVKAVEYWLRDALKARGAEAAHLEWLHFGCTSEDINNLAYALMMKSAARKSVLLPAGRRRWSARWTN